LGFLDLKKRKVVEGVKEVRDRFGKWVLVMES
jgi:hypothetical protein